MTANPITDQILAKLDDSRRAQRRPTPAVFTATFDLFARRISESLPAVPPAVVGQVLLHAGELYASLATNDGATPLSAESRAAVLTLCEAGRHLYAPGDTAPEGA